MNLQLRIVCRPEVAAGFGLASVPVREAPTIADSATVLRELLDDPAIGVVLVEDDQFNHLPDDLRRRIAHRALPMVVPFPGPSWQIRPEQAESYIVELLRQVIGYRVRLR
jgi:vacuolar-type H+-ATPase subunit F/Vma7